MSIIQEIEKILQENLDKIRLSGNLNSVKYLLVHGYNNIIIFIFCEGEKNPCAVAKIDPHKRGVLKTEHTILCNLEKEKNIADTISKSLGYISRPNEEIIIETTKKGKRLSHFNLLFKEKGFENISEMVTDWLIKLHSLNKNGNSYILDDRILDGFYKEIEDTCKEDTDRFLPFAKRLRQLFNQVKGERILSVIEHGDFWPGNILIDDDNLGIVDWDKAKMEGYPICDLFEYYMHCSRLIYSPLYMRYLFDQTNLDDYIDNAVFDSGIGGIVAKHINKYCRTLGISMQAVKTIFLWHFINKYKNPDILEIFFKNEDKFLYGYNNPR